MARDGSPRPRLLLTSPCRPFPRIAGFACTDQMAFRLTRGQGLFCLYEHTHYAGLHLIAQNLSEPSVLLENPTMDQLRQELRTGYQWVGISFKIWHMERLREMCRMIRSEFPATRIVIGGYGAVCAPHILGDPEWRGLVDEICAGEGIRFMRRLLGEPEDAEITCCAPRIGSTLPWLNPRAVGTIGIVLSGLGCETRCPFCVTSYSTRGRYVEVLDAAGIHRAMRGYWARGVQSATIYDENFLDQKEKVSALGRLLRQDGDFGLRRYNYFAFGSARAVARYEPEELVLNGLDTLWIGVESKFSRLPKLAGSDLGQTFRDLHRVGIKTVGSTIVGDDYHTPQNIEEDIDYFVSLDPTFQQVSILTVVPPLPLWQRMRREGRLPPRVAWEDYHLYGHTLVYKNFQHSQLLEEVEKAYRRIYQENGPAVLKALEVNLNGWEFCARSRRSALRRDKIHYFRSRCDSYYPFLRTGIEMAPSPRVRRRLEDLRARWQALLGPPSAQQKMMEEAILRRAEQALPHLESLPPREEPFRRYTYGPRDRRPVGRPYQVEYPEGDPFVSAPAARV
ncbi:MAG TPA: hypothetical protein VNO81_01400 [Candidatus Nitrosotenuis sp.]|nr:hypothetical protein [Candidatus Nitrosotenuis sp.]